MGSEMCIRDRCGGVEEQNASWDQGAGAGGGVGEETGHAGGHMFALQSENYPRPADVLSTLVSKLALPDVSVFVAESTSIVHATGSHRHVYNKRRPSLREATIMLGGRRVKVECYGMLDVVLLSKLRCPVRVTLTNMAVVPDLAIDVISLSKIQMRHGISMDETGTYTLNNKVHFAKLPSGNYVAGMRLARGRRPPAILAALMESKAPRSDKEVPSSGSCGPRW